MLSEIFLTCLFTYRIVYFIIQINLIFNAFYIQRKFTGIIEPHEIVSYKLSCLCPKKDAPYIEVSSNFGTLACNSRKKIRIHAGDCIIRKGTLKTIFGNFNHINFAKLKFRFNDFDEFLIIIMIIIINSLINK